LDFTTEEKLKLLNQYKPLLLKTMQKVYTLHFPGEDYVRDALKQMVVEGFLAHLRKINDIKDAGKCGDSLVNYVVEDIRSMYIVSISRDNFRAKRGAFSRDKDPSEVYISYDDSGTEEEIVWRIVTDEFLKILTPEEQKALTLRVRLNCTDREIAREINAAHHMVVPRMFKQIKKKYLKFIEGK